MSLGRKSGEITIQPVNRSQLLTLLAALSLCSSAEATAKTETGNDAKLLLRACALRILLSSAANFKNPSAQSCDAPSLKVSSYAKDLENTEFDPKLTSRISYGDLGSFTIEAKSKSGIWFNYVRSYLPSKKLSVEFIREGKSPYTTTSKADRDALAWLHSCRVGVLNYFASTYNFSSIWDLESCSNSKVNLSVMALIFNLSSKYFDLESEILRNGDEGYSISVRSKSGKWFSLVWAYDDLLPQIPPLLIEGRPTP